MPFAGAATTGAITCFHTGRRNREMRFRLIEDLSRLGSSRAVGGLHGPAWEGLAVGRRSCGPRHGRLAATGNSASCAGSIAAR